MKPISKRRYANKPTKSTRIKNKFEQKNSRRTAEQQKSSRRAGVPAEARSRRHFYAATSGTDAAARNDGMLLYVPKDV